MAILEIEGLTKHYGNVAALDGFSLTIEPGQAVGFVGRNGAGKTTTMRLLMGLMRADSGRVRLFGEDPWALSPATRQRIGYVGQSQDIYGWMRVSELARLAGQLNPRWNWDKAEKLLKLFEVPCDRKLDGLSGGMKKKLWIVLAMATEPDLLLLDEPASELDPVARRDFFDSILDVLRNEQKTVLISSHILSDVERFCTHVALIDRGRRTFQGTLKELRETVVRVHLEGTTDIPPINAPWLLRVHNDPFMRCLVVSPWNEHIPLEIEEQYGLSISRAEKLSLEEAFFELVGRDG